MSHMEIIEEQRRLIEELKHIIKDKNEFIDYQSDRIRDLAFDAGNLREKLMNMSAK